MKYLFSLLSYAAALVLGLAASPAAQAAPITGYTFTTNLDSFESTPPATVTIGFRFTANQNVFVTSLGIVDSGDPGLNSSHDVGLWTDSGTLLASSRVPSGTGASLIDGFRFEDIAPVPLVSGQTYRVGAVFFFANGDNEIEAPSRVGAAQISLLNSGLSLSAEGDVLTFPQFFSGPEAAAANFRFDAVPEPGPLALLGVGVLMFGWSRRRPRAH